MNAVNKVLVGTLVMTTLAGAGIAYQQYQRAERLEALVAGASAADGTAQAQSSAASPRETQPAPSQPDVNEPADVALEDLADPASEGEAGARRRMNPAARFNALMEDPEFAVAWQTQQRSQVDRRYADLFRRLNLSPAQIDQLKSLLAEREAARMDVLAAARAQGLTGRGNREEIRTLMQQTQAEVDQSIRETLGDAGFAQLQQYEQTAAERATVGQLEQRLSYSSAPLTEAQADALVAILNEGGGNGSVNVTTGGPGAPMGMSFGAGAGAISDAALARAQAILSPAQLAALREVQAEQVAQRRVGELMRQQFRRPEE